MKYKRSLATARRFNQIVGMLIRYGFGEIIEQETAQKAHKWLLETFGREESIPKKFEEQKTMAERARLLLQELGPTFVKFGQMAASQSSSLPEEWVEELSLLQSDVPPVSGEEIEAIILEEFGLPSGEVYASFELESLAAASIGQVHRATLPNGTLVAVKVQRPGIVPKIEEDLTIMHDVASMLEGTIRQAKEFAAVKAVNEFAMSLMEELSYRHEGRNTERLRQNLASFSNIRTAKIFWDFSTDRVLTMEFIAGIKPTKHKQLEEAGIDCEQLAKDFARCMSQQILIDGFFHADPHPGNLSVLLEEKQIIFLDTGMMGILDKSERRDLVQLMLAIYQRDAPALAKVALNLGTTHKEVDRRGLSHELERLIGGILDAPLSEVGGGRFFSDLIRMLQEYGITLPSGMVMALKSLMQMLEVILALHPRLTFGEVTEIVTNTLIEHSTTPDAFKDFMQSRVQRLQLLGPLVDDAVEEFLRQTQRGSLNVELRGLNLSKETQVLARIARHFTQALLLSGAAIGTAIAMAAPLKGTWSFVPAFAAVGFVVTIVLSIWLLFQDSRKD